MSKQIVATEGSNSQAASRPRFPRSSRTRDRHGRGLRGPEILPVRLGVPERRTSRELFDDLVLAVVAELEERWKRELGLVEYAVEDTPQIPDDWQAEHVPLSSLVRGAATRPTRIVLFRRPIEHRAEDRAELEALVHTVIVEQVAELLGLPADDVDPRYEP